MATTKERLLDAAATLLDAGGESAVTLRAVSHAVGVSHNAPYKHFRDRDAILAAMATREFVALTHDFVAARTQSGRPLTKLRRALRAFLAYAEARPERYRLVFGNAAVAAAGGDTEAAALRCFAEFAAIVEECQSKGALPDMPPTRLAGLIYASTHGLIDLQSRGGMRAEKGLADAAEGVALLVATLSGPRDSGAVGATRSSASAKEGGAPTS